MKMNLLKTLTPELSVVLQNDIPVLYLKHQIGTAKIALQGAQLLSWQPGGQSKTYYG
ncbi:aldose 1-epimerase [Rodentibacter pneumotropicus]|uniref:Aldose 1-epimerase n=1 Tax=Rodentibacter pneumotropicus TaxID=758 RepID=A0A3S4TVW4_9PAST|nr:aldose 1-epimerase [Rodentibacter pneumotropicus]